MLVEELRGLGRGFGFVGLGGVWRRGFGFAGKEISEDLVGRFVGMIDLGYGFVAKVGIDRSMAPGELVHLLFELCGLSQPFLSLERVLVSASKQDHAAITCS